MKRFWKQAAAMFVEDQGGWGVSLDGKPVRLPEGPVMTVASPDLAEALAAEWRGAGLDGEDVNPAHLPLTGLAGAVFRIAQDPASSLAAIARYADSDLLCYRVPSGKLAARQAELWGPWLDWAARELGADLHVTTEIAHLAQSGAAMEALRRAVAAQNAYGLAMLGVTVPALGSLVLGLALAAGRIGAEEACRLATLEERFQAEEWGEDAEAAARLGLIAAEVAAATRFLELSRLA